MTHPSTLDTTAPDMNNEPKIQLPEPPTGHTWQYRGMGWNPGREIAAYVTVWDESSGDPAYRPYAVPNGLADYHYWEAVASAPDIPLIEQLRTELDAAQGIAEALENRIALLKMKCDNWKETAAQYWNNAQYYRDLVIQCGQAIGKAAYTSDDGTTQEDVLCAKVPGLVRGLVMRADKWPDSKPMLIGGIRTRPDGKLEFEDVEQPDPHGVFCELKPDHAAGGKYRRVKPGEMLQPGDEFLFCNDVAWMPVAAFHSALSGQLYRRPVKPEDIDPPDYAAYAKNILQRYFGSYADTRDTGLDTFVDLIIKAAKQ